MENANLKVLDREGSINDVKENFHNQIELLKDLVNFGTQLIVRILHGPNKNIDQFVVVSILFKHLVTMLDSIEILISNGAVTGASLQARSIMETSLNIEWILKEDTIRRAKLYYVGYYRKEIRNINSFINKYKSDKTLVKRFEHAKKELKLTQDFIEEADNELVRINNLLKNPLYSSINKEFDEKENSLKKPKVIDWYVLTGVWSIRELADKLDQVELYYIFYSVYSKIIHASAIHEHINFTEENITLRPIRELHNIDSLLSNTLSFVFRSFISVIKTYRPGETKLFAEKYAKIWREPFVSIKKVIYG